MIFLPGLLFKEQLMSNQSIFTKRISPYIQGAVVMGLIFIGQVGIKIAINPQEAFGKLDYWILSCAFLLLYAVVASVFSFSAPSPIKYYGQSVTSFLGVAFLGGVSAYLFSGIPLDEAGSFTWIYTVLAVIFVVFLTIVNLMRKIVELAKKQEKKLRNEN